LHLLVGRFLRVPFANARPIPPTRRANLRTRMLWIQRATNASFRQGGRYRLGPGRSPIPSRGRSVGSRLTIRAAPRSTRASSPDMAPAIEPGSRIAWRRSQRRCGSGVLRLSQ
jgi:hypothetical protein